MIMGILLWAVIMVMLFTVPDLPETGMWIYYIDALLLYSVFYTQFTVPWQALNSAMTRDPQERNLMLTCRQYGGFIAGAVVGVITIPIVQKSADPRTGWLISVGIVCVTMIITASVRPTEPSGWITIIPFPLRKRSILRARSDW